MSLEPSEKLDQLLRKLSQAVDEDQEVHIFTSKEVLILRNMIEAYKMFLSWGKLGRLAIWIVVTIAALKIGLEQIWGGPVP